MLPVAEICPQLVSLLTQSPRVILSAPPGAGKSTFLPLYLLQQADFANKRIIMLEPRRLAAKNIAAYLARQLGEAVGQTVGYQIRQEQLYSDKTRLLIVTEGILTRKIQQDPALSAVDLLIFDEFHERSLHADLALALSLDVQQLRDDLKLLLMSATLNTQLLQQQLQAPLLVSEGRSYDVDIRYIAPDLQLPLWQQTARVAFQAIQQHQGSILVFLPGQAEIQRAADWLSRQSLPETLQLFTLSGSQSLAEQQAAIIVSADGYRKIVLATNLAETSLTIEGIEVVVDSGVCRRARFLAKQGITMLETVPVSQASAIQRAGRAGRLMAGTCYRLDTAEKWQRRPAFDAAEIDIAELTALRLEVAVWGAQVSDLCWITVPPQAHLAVAEQLLQQLGLLNAAGQLTERGNAVHKLGTEPRLGTMLLHAGTLQQTTPGTVWLACLLAALLEDSRQLDDDLYRQLQQLQQQPERNTVIYRQALRFARLLQTVPVTELPLEKVPLLLLRAWPDRLAKRRGQGYQLSGGSGAVLPADHPLQQQDLLVVLHLQQWQQQNRITKAVAISLDDIQQDWRSELVWSEQTGWDEKQASFTAEQHLKFGHCLLQRRKTDALISPEQRQQAWLSYIRKQGLQLLPWQPETEQLVARLGLLHSLQPQSWPDVSEAVLQENLHQWLGPYLSDISNTQQLQRLPLYDILLNMLDYTKQQQLQRLLPAHWLSPVGSRLAIDYTADGCPRLSVRIQEMYGQINSPTVLDGKIPLTLVLLSPAHKPLQVTQDLASFWQNAWQDVKKEMKGRYPKHYWPDDPVQAIPTSKTKKAMQL